MIDIDNYVFEILVTTSASISSEYNGTLSYGDPTFARPNGNGKDYYYKRIQMSIFTAGTYTLSLNSSISICYFLYMNNFNQSSPSVNLIDKNGYMYRSNQFTTSFKAQSTDTYILVVTSYINGDTGSFEIKGTGPTQPDFNLLPTNKSKYILRIFYDANLE